MEGGNLQKPYKQRFKGVENFLRRIAFNLGNTPSQTEVKIISCIPIDVTDLQQKIINLEKQLYEAQQAEVHAIEPSPLDNDQDNEKAENNDQQADTGEKKGHPTVVNTAFVRRSSAVSYTNRKPVENFRAKHVSAYCGDCSTRQRKSNVSFVFPAISTPIEQLCVSQENYNKEDNDEFERRLGNDLYKNIFRRRKKKKTVGGKSKIKTQLIYYAQESPKSPFHIKDKSLLRNQIMNNEKNILSQSYLDTVVRKQYDPKIILEEFSDTSHFSKPICRDNDNNIKHRCHYESDVCSCCYGKFQNLDNFITNNISIDPIRSWTYKQNERNKSYYDSNLYDVVPVKENPNKFLKPDAIHKNDHKRQLDMKCWPENYRTKRRYHPFIINYHTQIPIRRPTNKKQTRVKRNRSKKSQKWDDFETSKSCCIECSDIYRKSETPVVKLRKSEPTRTILLKNEFVETENNTLQAQANNQSTQSKLFRTEENKTESTLSQIKSILQSVLQEVKTNSNVNTVPEKPKKDAVIQKGSSQNNMSGNSTFLHSFTYNNSCNTNPYLPSCSRQMSPGQYCLPGMSYQPVKCLQNFPVFIHPSTGRPMCACYYKHSSHKASHNKQATASTNTDKDIQKSSSNETEKLIKEIYKSMALNMDYPTKENSLSETDDLKSTEMNSIAVSNKEEKSTEAEILKKRDIEIEAMVSPLISNPNENKFVYTAASSQSENNRFVSDLSFGYTPVRNNNYERRNFKEVERQNTETNDEMREDTDVSSDETESDETIVLDEGKQKKKEKKGLFKRMINSVKLFKKRKESQEEKSENNEDQSEDSDSDDYQTIYSGRTGKSLNTKLRPNKRKQYSEVKTDHSKRKVKKSPYLEQEYRRQWNENLMFHDQHERYSSERPFSKPTTSQPSAQPAYWRNYEARRASVKQNVPSHLFFNQPFKQNMGNDSLSPKNNEENVNNAKGKLAWFKKHNLGIHCGEQWKKFILEN